MAGNTDEFKIKTIFEATVDRFNKAVDSAMKQIEKFEAITKNIDDVELDADAEPLEKKVSQAKKALDFIDHKQVKAIMDINDRFFKTKFDKAKAEIEKLDNSNVNVDLEVDSAKASAEVSTFKAKLRSIPNIIRTKLKVDTSENSKFGQMLKSLNDKTDEYQKRMDKLSKSIRNFGTISQNVLQGTLLFSWSALIPIIASCVPVIMAAGNALAVVGGGALGVAGALGIAGAGLLGFGVMAKTATSMLKDGLIEADEATQRYQKSLDSLKSTWQGIVKQNADAIFNSMSNAIDGVTSAVKQLSPFLSGVANLMQHNTEQFKNWVQTSDTAKKAFQTLNTTGVQVFGDLMNAAGRFGDGFINILTQFAPLFKWISQGLQNMSIEFQKWANSVGTAQGIQQFINYVKTNLPVIGRIFGNVFMGIFNIFKAFGSNSQGLLQNLADITAKFRQWSEGLANSQGFKTFMQYMQQNAPVVAQLLGSIARVIGRVIVAMAPIGSVILRVVTAFASLLDKLTQFSPIFSVLIGAVAMIAGAFMALVPVFTAINAYFGSFGGMITKIGSLFTSLGEGLSGLAASLAGLSAPVLIVIGVIAALIAVFVYLWNTNEDFRNGVIAVWNAIKTFVINAVNAIATFIKNVWGGISTWWNENHQAIFNTVKNIWNSIKNFISTAIDTVMNVITTVINAIVEVWNTGWNAFKTVISTVWNIIVTIVSTAIKIVLGIIFVVIGILVTIWQAEWNAIVAIAQFVWGIIGNTVMTAINFVKDIIMTVLNVIVTIWTTIWNAIVTVATFVWNAIVTAITVAISFVSNIISIEINFILSVWSAIWNRVLAIGTAIWNAIVSVVTTLMNAMKNTLSAIWNAIVSAVRVAWNFVKSTIIDRITAAWQVVSSKVQAIWSAVSNAFNNVVSTVRSAMSSFFNAISEKVQAAYNAVANYVQRFYNAGRDLIMGLVNGVKNFASNLIDAVSGAVGNAIDKAKSLLHINSPSKVFYEIGDYTMQGFANGVKGGAGGAIDAVAGVVSKVIDTFNPQLNTPDLNFASGLSNVSASTIANVAHHHTFEDKPTQRVVRIEMHMDNDALTAIVNDKNAENDAVFEF